MKTFMGLSIFILGLLSIALGIIIIIRDRIIPPSVAAHMAADAAGTPRKEPLLKLITDLINAIANLCEKLFGQFVPKEKLPVFLIVIGIIMCVLGWYAAK